MTSQEIAGSAENRRLEGILDRRRYRRVITFFAGLIADIVLWEIVLRQLAGRRVVAASRDARMARYARGFRKLAIQMGGVMIKLGQFVSARIDVMPPAIINELADLQDEVPPESLSTMLPLLHDELGSDPEQVFEHFDPVARAAASLGQVYCASLKDGRRAMVKVQRPHIERSVATDLAALSQVARWTMRWSAIRKRADVPALIAEFAATLWDELDYIAEAENAAHFEEIFRNDFRVYIPEIYQDFSTEHVITLEDVTAIKITDHVAIKRAGIDRATAARHLLDLYLRMIFEQGFFHADPHPGNLFLYPIPATDARTMYKSGVPYDGTPFYVVFVDFGMVGRITEETKASLRELLIAVATRDSKRVLNAYKELGVLLPSADLTRIEQAEEEVLKMVWGRSVPDLAQMPRSEMRQFASKYRDLLYEMPFQIPQDFIYLARAVGMLSGICTSLDPEFNPWEMIGDYAQKLISREARASAPALLKEATRIGQAALTLPHQSQEVLTQIQRGDLRARVTADGDLQKDLRRLQHTADFLARAVIFSGLVIGSSMLFTAGYPIPGYVGFTLAGISALTVLALPGSRR